MILSNMIKRPRGTRDFVPEVMEKRKFIEKILRRRAEIYGFREIGTPTFEDIRLFTMRSSESIIKEMYDFKDKGDRHLALRPELTAPAMRMYIEEMQSYSKPLKIFYFGNCFRYERPQMGRYREFWQFGVEIIGAEKSMAEAEVISLACDCISSSGLQDYNLRIGHIGILMDILRDADVPHDKIRSLMTLIDKKDMECLKKEIRSMGGNYGQIEESLNEGIPNKYMDRYEDFKRMLYYLDNLGIKEYTLDAGIARGLDYYDGTVFEVDVDKLGAEKQICGGGTYSLLELFGGEKLLTTGFGIGFDRLLMAIEKTSDMSIPTRKIKYFIIPLEEKFRKYALSLITRLRCADVPCDLDISGRSLSKCMKYAHVIGSENVIIIGENEINEGKYTVKNMISGVQKMMTLDEIIES